MTEDELLDFGWSCSTRCAPKRRGEAVLGLAVYDAMVIFQWAALPEEPNREHATVRAITSGEIRLAMSQPLLDEIRGVLFRPELQQKFPSLTLSHAAAIIKKTLEYADWFANPPMRFSLPQHPKDDHLFDLVIESKAKYLVTWETRLLKLRDEQTTEAGRLRTWPPACPL